MQTSDNGIKMIEREEGYRKYAYPDPSSELAKATQAVRWGHAPAAEIIAKLPSNLRNLDPMPWTCGIGQTQGVTINTVMDEAEAAADLRRSLPTYEAMVINSCTRTPTQEQFDALVCLAWNCPPAVNKNSSIIKAHNRGDFAAAAKAFELYNKSKGVVNPSLSARRKREALAYLTTKPVNSETEYQNLMPQTVDPEKPLSRSKINIASGTGGIVATMGVVHEMTDAIKQFQDDAATLKTLFMPLALVAIVVLCGVIIWQRVGLRKDGVV